MRFFAVLISFLLLSGSVYADGQQYNRNLFPHWVDLDGDGRDTRREILVRDIVGGIICPYSGVLIQDMSLVDIDHIVPLKWAWINGAYNWDAEKRKVFANDPENLLAVSRATNRNKSADGPDKWLPPNTYFIPEYVLKFSNICDKYGLTYDKKQFDAIVVDALRSSKGVRK